MPQILKKKTAPTTHQRRGERMVKVKTCRIIWGKGQSEKQVENLEAERYSAFLTRLKGESGGLKYELPK
jgi:hypothetical protein